MDTYMSVSLSDMAGKNQQLFRVMVTRFVTIIVHGFISSSYNLLMKYRRNSGWKLAVVKLDVAIREEEETR